jgi:hypothetical protein
MMMMIQIDDQGGRPNDFELTILQMRVAQDWQV